MTPNTEFRSFGVRVLTFGAQDMPTKIFNQLPSVPEPQFENVLRHRIWGWVRRRGLRIFVVEINGLLHLALVENQMDVAKNAHLESLFVTYPQLYLAR